MKNSPFLLFVARALQTFDHFEKLGQHPSCLSNAPYSARYLVLILLSEISRIEKHYTFISCFSDYFENILVGRF